MRATCKRVSALDFRRGSAHMEELILGDGGIAVERGRRKDEWGSSAASALK